MFLTKTGGLIIKPISTLLGYLLSLIYEALNAMGIVNIGIAIIIFTIVVRLCFLPITFNQSKSSKISNYIQPEIKKIQKKYKGKKDQESMMAQQNEISKLQAQYGVSLGAGCLTSLIQLPIFLALYRVILNVPAYVSKIKDLYTPIANAIMNNEKVAAIFEEFCKDDHKLSVVSLDLTKKNTIIDVLAKFEEGTWDKFGELVKDYTDITNTLSENVDKINETYSFIGGINLTTAPGFALTTALAIPILSMIFQFLSMHATPMQEPSDPQQAQSMKAMKTFMNIMPIMSFLICISVPAGVGLYWATGSLVSFITSVSVNFYFSHCDMDKVVEKSKAKAKKKIAKRKAQGKKTFMERMQEAAAMQQNANNQNANSQSARNSTTGTNLRNYSSTAANKSGTRYKAGSLASKANALQTYNYNDKNGGKK